MLSEDHPVSDPGATPSAARVDSPEGVNPIQAQSLAFWRALSTKNAAAYIAALRRLQAMMSGSSAGSMFSFEELSAMTQTSDLGKSKSLPLEVELPPNTPTAVKTYWSSPKYLSLTRIDAARDCLGGVLGLTAVDFVGCGEPRAGTGVPGECTTTSHAKPTHPRVIYEGAAWAIQVKGAKDSTRDRVLAGSILREEDLPEEFEIFGIDQSLLRCEALAGVWRQLLTNYPGAARMSEFILEFDSGKTKALKQQAIDSADVGAFDASITAGVLRATTVLEHPSPSQSKVEASAFGVPTATSPGVGQPGLPTQGFAWADSFDEDGWSVTGSSRCAVSEPGRGQTGLIRKIEQQVGEGTKKLERLTEKVKSWDERLKAKFDSVKKYVDRADHVLEGMIDDLELAPPSMPEGAAVPAGSFVLDSSAQEKLLVSLLARIDTEKIVSAVLLRIPTPPPLAPPPRAPLAVDTGAQAAVEALTNRVAALEREVLQPAGLVHTMLKRMDEADARRGADAIDRGGSVFRDQRELEALLSTINEPEFYKYMLDIFSILNISQGAFDSYEKGIKAEADAIKANYTDMTASRVKLSFKTPYPEPVLRKSETLTCQARGGTRWAPLFASPEIYDDDYRTGTHAKLLLDVETVYDLTQRAIDHDYPIGEKRIINAILSDQNRKTFSGTVGFLNCLLPFYKTCKKGGLSNEDAWDRVRVMTQEIFDDIQSVRVVSSKFTVGDLCWGAMLATDRVEMYRRDKFIECPKVTSILALTSMEREGKSIAEAMSAFQGDKEKLTRVDTLAKKLEKDLKTLKDKNPSLK